MLNLYWTVNQEVRPYKLYSEFIKADLRAAQLEACKDPEKKYKIAYELVKAKIQRSNDVLKWLGERHDIEKMARKVNIESLALARAKAVSDIRTVEGRVAEVYWKTFQRVIPKKYGFVSRMHETHQMNSTDPLNTLLNYGYAFLESRCRTSINSVGLEPSVGFLHEIAQPKYPPVYDLQEPFRWIVDKTTLSCIEDQKFSKKDFFMTDNYVLRLRSSVTI